MEMLVCIVVDWELLGGWAGWEWVVTEDFTECADL